MINGENQSLSILVSSSQYDSSFTNQRIKELADDPHAYIVNAKIYDVKPQNYSKDRFSVFIGSGELDPMIIETTAEVVQDDTTSTSSSSDDYHSIDNEAIQEAIKRIEDAGEELTKTTVVDEVFDLYTLGNIDDDQYDEAKKALGL